MSKHDYTATSHDFPEVAQSQSGDWGHQAAADPRGAAPEYYDQSQSGVGNAYSPQSAVGSGTGHAYSPQSAVGGDGMGGAGVVKPASAASRPGAGAGKGPWRTPLTLTLLAIIGMLSATVIGLAVGTGVEASRASDARATVSALNARLATASAAAAAPTATVTTTVTRARAAATGTGASPSASATGAAAYNLIDDGCSLDPDAVTGTNYTAFGLLGGNNFTRYCNKDTAPSPVLSLFAADFDTCMDACAGFVKYHAETDSSSCGGVSFIPLWTDKSSASKGGAPGNCYLKAGPLNSTDLKTANIGTEVHAALLV